ncbi:3-methyl-2-oxobutanoate hydroxymethyltransferase [Tuwongella immobilis]|uniref:3-methyl-2-oxobutanoate hydroxymethyltransferase n=1 Tax=Tuwongella immobilis TaxID=692036 RepID=A0A6C2YRX1_9BACT|nr:3-methyl-2-oxobutanoate hydroxymethyltransferase [Tuwongella immobilis]VIP03899.1 3-methyl-2-oxobutanoate hydroxymethyltransferase : 3-methyl-2-oxobutanoate hydroxymethyltransferase OS=Singulisphaera acidiphila (strain ATCC BAA-1392 / DSM 18658 / VKM B-2454 / MOB10) GN=panB PE=3 SV=1: Pantoate_transf [Tuwongella immobilis]VTS05165.1 3-methyl-2-oxobutanoate hydroxymethyltransferase : 3-methyl-2-oxobutanoate hydroxymethyltransferase OS=Singulisphaera acidiphila (strain ATCC BAA-1392 / DSM 18658 
MSTHTPPAKPMTVPEFIAAKGRGQKLAVLTAYDFTSARLLDQAGVDAILIGDSLGMVVQGNPHCLTVTLDEMIYHTRCVARGTQRALLITDLPFMTYQVSPEQALISAGRAIQEGGAHAVKLEGGERSADAIAKVVSADIPVMGHLGLTPQSIHRMGGFKVQRAEEQLLRDAKAVEQAGAFSIVLECIPAELAKKISDSIAIPTIGIGAGVGCDGQVLVYHDVLGLFGEFRPKFVKRYAELGPIIHDAAARYCEEVRQGRFPDADHQFKS